MADNVRAFLEIVAPTPDKEAYTDEKFEALTERAVAVVMNEYMGTNDDVDLILLADSHGVNLSNEFDRPVPDSIQHSDGGGGQVRAQARGMSDEPAARAERVEKLGFEIGRNTGALPLGIALVTEAWRAVPPDGMTEEEQAAWFKNLPDDIEEIPPENLREGILITAYANQERTRTTAILFGRDDHNHRVFKARTNVSDYIDNYIDSALGGWILGYIENVKTIKPQRKKILGLF